MPNFWKSEEELIMKYWFNFINYFTRIVIYDKIYYEMRKKNDNSF